MNETPPEPVQPPASPVPSEDTLGFPPPDSSGETAVAPQRRIGDFTVVHILGEGGMGTVYLAEDRRLRRKAAVKTMKPELAAKAENRGRFLREAQAAAAIDHDNVVPIWQVGEEADGSLFIAMPLLQGEMLEARLRREPIPPLALTLKVALEVAEGLAAAHAAGLTHRDIKPSNVWLEGDPAAADLARQVRRCKILDFGLARAAGNEDVQITGSGVILGTPAYMAPEQARGEAIDHRADLFSLGVMLYRMTTGTLPFDGPNAMAVLHALANVTRPARTLNPDVPETLSGLIGRLMSKDPARRPRSAAEVAAEVRRIAEDVPGRRPPPSPIGSEDTVAIESGMAPTSRAMWSRTPLLIALALLTLVPLGWWLASGVLRLGFGDASKGNDADRKAAEWVLSLGGGVQVNDQDRDIKAVADLPPGAFRLTGANLPATEQVSDAGLAYFKDCKSLTGLGLWGTRVTDAGLAQLEACEGLKYLGVQGVAVSDAGLVHLGNCKNLEVLGLHDGSVSDSGLAPLQQCKALTKLELVGIRLADAGLARLEGCKNLTELVLKKTKATAARVEALKKALPRCKIDWDGGDIEPRP